MAIVKFCYISSILFVAAVCVLQHYHVFSLECGRVDVTIPLIRAGNATLRGEWPFIVALYKVRPVAYICGGTLISNRHVLTGKL